MALHETLHGVFTVRLASIGRRFFDRTAGRRYMVSTEPAARSGIWTTVSYPALQTASRSDDDER